MFQLNILDSIKDALPTKPYTLMDKGCAMFITSIEAAIKSNPRYIQANQPNSLSFMVFDLDYKKAILAHEKTDVLTPSFYTVDKKKTTAHAVYMLETPVHKNQHSKQSPQHLFATLEDIYGTRLGADKGYSGLVMKNPFYTGHNIYLPEETLCTVSLAEMADYVDFNQYNKQLKQQKTKEAFSEGRNIAVFDLVREWAYKEIRNYWNKSYREWLMVVQEKTKAVWHNIQGNYNKQSPYSVAEMKATARSIAKWTWKNTTQSSFQTYIEMTHLPHQQRARQAKQVESRLIKTQDKREQARELRASGMKQAEIANLLGVTDRTIRNWLAMHQDEQ
jgi:DNA-binding transcriptional regulator YiaG